MPLPKLTIQYLDERLEVVDLKPSARVAWERHFGVPYMSMLIAAQVAEDKGEDPNPHVMLEHLFYLAYVCLNPKADPADFDDWLGTIENVFLGDLTQTAEDSAEVPEGPLAPTAPPGS